MAPTPSRKRKEPEAPGASPAASLTTAGNTRLTKQQKQEMRERAKLAVEQQMKHHATTTAPAATAEETFTSPTKRRRVSVGQSNRSTSRPQPPPAAAATAAATKRASSPVTSKLTKKEQREIARRKAARWAAEAFTETHAHTPPKPAPTPARPSSSVTSSTTASPAPVRISPSAAVASTATAAAPAPSIFNSPPPVANQFPLASSPSVSESPASEGSTSPPQSRLMASGTNTNAPAPLFFSPPTSTNAPLFFSPPTTTNAPAPVFFSPPTSTNPTPQTSFSSAAPASEGSSYPRLSSFSTLSHLAPPRQSYSTSSNTRNNANVSLPPVMNHAPAMGYFQIPATSSSAPSHIATFHGTTLASPNHYQGGLTLSSQQQLTPIINRMEAEVERNTRAPDVDKLAHDLNLADEQEPKQKEAQAVQRDQSVSEKPNPKKKSRLQFLSSSTCIAVLVAVCAIGTCSYTDVCNDVLTSISAWTESLNWTSSVVLTQTLPPCFYDTAQEEDVYERPTDPVLGVICRLPEVPCPEGGICKYGLLQDCSHRHRQVASTKDACILTNDANQTLLAAQQFLEIWTVQHLCHVEGCAFAVQKPEGTSSTGPWFLFSQLVGELDVEWDLELFSQVPAKFSIHKQENDSILIALSNEFIDQSLPVPWWCLLKRWTVGSVLLLVNSILAVFRFLAMGSFSVVKTYPMSCLSALAAIFTLVVIVRFRSERGRLRAQVAKVCRMARRRLQDAAPAKVPVLHVRDEIAWELYPNAEADRKYLKTNVWPRVMQDLEQDNRIGKESAVVDRKFQRTWQWLAVTPRKSGGD